MDNLRGAQPQALSMHYYTGGRDRATEFTQDHANDQLSIYARVEQAIAQQRSLLDSYRDGQNIGLILDEWGVWDRIPPDDEKRYGKLWQQSTMRSAVAAGLGLNIFNRQADKLYMCNIAQIMNVLQSLLLSDGPNGERCVRTTTYHAFALFKAHRAQRAIRTETESSSPLGLSVSASKGNQQLVVSLVNPRGDADLQVECTLSGSGAKSGTAQILHDKDMNACNSFEQPDRVVPRPHPVEVNGSKVRIDLPRLSLATVALQTS
jgi:alpha-N-arabinofuranosidase